MELSFNNVSKALTVEAFVANDLPLIEVAASDIETLVKYGPQQVMNTMCSKSASTLKMCDD